MDSLKLSANQVRAVIALGLVGFLGFINWPFLMPLILAGLFALGTKDLIVSLGAKLRLNYRVSVWVGMALGLFLFWFPLFIATYRVFVFLGKKNQEEDSSDWMSRLQAIKTWSLEQVQSISEMLGIDLTSPIQALLEKSVTVIGEVVLKMTTEFFQQLPSLFIASIVFTISLLTFLLGAAEIKAAFLKFNLLPKMQLEGLVEAAQKSCRLTLFSTIVIGIIQATLIGIGSLIFHQGDFWLIMILTFFVSFIPVIGAAPVGFLLAILAYIEGSPGSAVGLIIVSLIAGSIDNLLKPLIMSSVVKVPAILAFTSVVGAVIILGLPGLILGPIILNLTVLVVPMLADKETGEA